MAFPALFGYSEEHQIGSNTFWKLQTDCLNPDASFLETLGKVIVSVAGIPVGGYCTQRIILLGFIAALKSEIAGLSSLLIVLWVKKLPGAKH